jgi:putative addiction module component (TIGR02574 family)
MTHLTVPPEIRDLPVPERMALVDQIWDTIAEDEAEFQLTNAQEAELDRRLARRQSSGSSGSDWGDVKRRLVGES